MVELYEKDGKVAVLVSGGYGAGWSTWGSTNLAYDKRIVEFYLAHRDDKNFMLTIDKMGYIGRNGNVLEHESEAHKEAVRFFKSIGYNECPYMSGSRAFILSMCRKV